MASFQSLTVTIVTGLLVSTTSSAANALTDVFPAQQAQGAIMGRVTAAGAQRPLAGAQVTIPGTGLGTLTTSDGRYLIPGVPEGEVLVRVQLIGYETEERTVNVTAGGTVTVNFELAQRAVALQEIVVTGRATGIERRNLANAVGTVSGQDLSRVASENIMQAMTAQVPGVSVFSNNGAPGGAGEIELRGVTSIIGNSSPLYVIDGVIVSNDHIPSGQGILVNAAFEQGFEDNSPSRIADLNPYDIESITILKGPSAAAIYGSKASNGVIIIETKGGTYNSEATFTFRQGLGVSVVSNTLGLRRFETEAAAVAAFGPTAAQYWDGPSDYVDHEGLLAGETGLNRETFLSVSGGGEDTRYFLSALLRNDNGVIIGTGYEKRSLRLNLDHRIGSIAEIRVNTNAIQSDTRRGFTNNDNASISYWMTLAGTPSFIDLTQRADGTFPENPFAASNPFQTANLAQKVGHTNRFIGSAELSIHPLTTPAHDVELRMLGGIDYYAVKGELYSPPRMEYEPIDGLTGMSILTNTHNRLLNASANVIYDYTPASGLQTTTSAGFQYEERTYDLSQVIAQNLIAGISNIDRGTNTDVSQNRLQVQDFGLYLQQGVIVGENLYLTASIRGDQSSANSDPTKMFYYPKAAASYRFTDLPSFLDDIKVRAAWGQSGNQPLYGQKFILLNGGNISGLQTLELDGSVAVPNLHPERQIEYEAGLDVTAFDGRASLKVTAYQRLITDLLLRRSLAPSSGFDVLFMNGGEMRNRGIELALSAVPVQSESWSWTTNTTFYANRALVTELPIPPFSPPGTFSGLGGFRIEKGYSPTAIIGNAIINGDTLTDVRIGESRPDFSMGFSNTLRYDDFSLYGLVDWRHGGDIANLTAWLFDINRNSPDYAAPCNQERCLPNETLGEMRLRLYPFPVTSIYLEDASFIKLRELRLSWNIPQSIAQNLWSNISSARVSLSGRNLLTFTDYTGMDPEVSDVTEQSVARNQDIAPYPPSRSFWLTFQLSF